MMGFTMMVRKRGQGKGVRSLFSAGRASAWGKTGDAHHVFRFLQVQVNHASRRIGREGLPAIPTLRYVMSHIGYNHPSDSRHGPTQYQKTS